MNKAIWTEFYDMHSGGALKEQPYSKIYIEAEKEEAKIIFFNRFAHNAMRVSCTCCGSDYEIEEGNLDELTSYQRSENNETLDEYIKREEVKLIRKKDIKKVERIGTVPEQGYVWND